MIFPMKWVLLVLIVGSGGGSLTKLGSYASKDACDIAQSNLGQFLRSAGEDVHKTDSAAGFATITNCVLMPQENSPAGGGK